MWADVRAALADDQSLDDRPAHGAGFSLAAIDAEVILEFATAIDPVNARAVAADALLQDGLDCVV